MTRMYVRLCQAYNVCFACFRMGCDKQGSYLNDVASLDIVVSEKKVECSVHNAYFIRGRRKCKVPCRRVIKITVFCYATGSHSSYFLPFAKNQNAHLVHYCNSQSKRSGKPCPPVMRCSFPFFLQLFNKFRVGQVAICPKGLAVFLKTCRTYSYNQTASC